MQVCTQQAGAKLAPGEKSLSTLLVYQGEIIFTTFAPAFGSSAAQDMCAASGYTRRLYSIDGRIATPSNPATESTDPGARYVKLEGGGIPGRPVIIFPPQGGDAHIYVDNDKVRSIEQKLNHSYWNIR